MFGFFKRTHPAERQKASTVKGWVRAHLALAETDAVSVNQIECGDTVCPGIETAILVMRKGHATKAYRVRFALQEIDEQSVVEAITSQIE